MPKNKKYTTIDEALSKMNEGDLKMIKTGPGRTGNVSVKKGRETATGFQVESPRRSKVVPSPLVEAEKKKRNNK